MSAPRRQKSRMFGTFPCLIIIRRRFTTSTFAKSLEIWHSVTFPGSLSSPDAKCTLLGCGFSIDWSKSIGGITMDDTRVLCNPVSNKNFTALKKSTFYKILAKIWEPWGNSVETSNHIDKINELEFKVNFVTLSVHFYTL